MKTYFSRISLLISLICVSSFTFVPTVKAATGEPVLKPVCIKVEQSAVHSAKLIKLDQRVPVGKELYITVCISSEQGSVCTTGNKTLDTKLYGNDDKRNKLLYTTLKYNFEGMTPATNPVVSTDGDLPHQIIWTDSTPENHSRVWTAWYYSTPIDASVGSGGGNQQAQLDFSSLSKKCGSIAWDPLGRVFDATTLEPVVGATITLYEKEGETWTLYNPLATKHMGSTVRNPFTVSDKDPGRYSFLLENSYSEGHGPYKMVVNPPALTTLTTLHPNYKKSYYDIYPAEKGELVYEDGTLIHRDIPVNSTNVATQVKSIEYSYSGIGNGEILIVGRVSHPHAKLYVQTKKVMKSAMGSVATAPVYRTLDKYEADKDGKYEVVFDQAKLESTKDYVEVFAGLRIEKTDLKTVVYEKNLVNRLMTFFKSLFEVQAQSSSTTFLQLDPIPQYLEGYAYDAQGNPLTNATVSLYADFSAKPYSTVKTDEKGFYKIESNYIPSSPYTIRYTSAKGSVVDISPSQFIAQNQKYIVENKVNIYREKIVTGTSSSKTGNSGQQISSQGGSPTGAGTQSSTGGSTIGKTSGTGVSNGSATGEKKPLTEEQKKNNQFIVLLMFVIFLVVVGGVGVVVYMKKKQMSSPMEPPQM